MAILPIEPRFVMRDASAARCCRDACRRRRRRQSRQNTIRLVQRLDPPNEGWGTVLAEHEPPDPTLPEQCESVRVALARWAGVGEGE